MKGGLAKRQKSRFLGPHPGRQIPAERIKYGMSENGDVKELREKASKYRALARQTTDSDDANRIFQLAAEIEQQARDLERGS
jgi:hypothetical protein